MPLIGRTTQRQSAACTLCEGWPAIERGARVLSWLRKPVGGSPSAPMDKAERLTSTRRFPLRVKQDVASLSDEEVVRRWVRSLRLESKDTVIVHRPWGSVAAVCDGKHPIAVFLTDGEHTWSAEPLGAADQTALTPEQVEHVVLDGLTSSQRPQWPRWSLLV